jgi:hypothetical protein
MPNLNNFENAGNPASARLSGILSIFLPTQFRGGALAAGGGTTGLGTGLGAGAAFFWSLAWAKTEPAEAAKAAAIRIAMNFFL